MIVCGIDLSLAKTGMVVLEEGGKVLSASLVKSKPCGDLPIDETRRMVKIVEDVFEKIDEVLPSVDPDLVVIENLAYLAKSNSLTQLAFLHHLTRALCVTFGWPFIVVFPTTLKKWATGSGKGDKNMMLLEVFKRWNFSASDDNICDAYALARLGHALLGTEKVANKAQEEVVNLVRKQL